MRECRLGLYNHLGRLSDNGQSDPNRTPTYQHALRRLWVNAFPTYGLEITLALTPYRAHVTG